MAKDEVTLLEVLRTAASALGIRFGEFTVRIAEGEVTIVRQLTSLKPADLAEIPAPPVES